MELTEAQKKYIKKVYGFTSDNVEILSEKKNSYYCRIIVNKESFFIKIPRSESQLR